MIQIRIKVKLCLAYIFVVLPVLCFSQNLDSLDQSNLYPFVVDSIKITGNETTEDFVIYRELTFSKGDTLTKETAFYNRERVYSLGIFNHVNFIPSVFEGKNILNIQVEESWYIYPIPYVETKENKLTNLSYGIFLKLKNFRGRNETLTAALIFGYDPSYSLEYYNPNFLGDQNIFFSSRVGYSNRSNRSPQAELLYGQAFTQKFITGQLLLGRRFGLYHKLYFTSGITNVETNNFFPSINASNDRIDNNFNVGVGYEYDTRDLSMFPQKGIYLHLQYFFKGLGIDNINYRSAYFDFREYRNLFGGLISKWRLSSKITAGNNVPFYDRPILGLDEKIRGHSSEKFEGDEFYTGAIEFYYPIIKELNIDLTFIPVIPDRLLSYRVGFYTQIFAETGVARFKKDPLKISNFNSGYGLGITLLVLPYQLFRVEVAFNEKMQAEMILDLGISF